MGPITSLRDIPRILLRRLLLVALILGIGLPLVLLYASTRPRVYEAIAVVQIEAAQVVERLTSQSGRPMSGLNPNAELDLIEQQLMARDNVLSVLEEFALFPEAATATERVSLMRQAVSIAELIDPADAWRPDAQPSGLVITVRLGDPDQAAGVANTFLDAVLAEAQERGSGRTARTLEFLVSEEARLTDEIETLEFAFTAFRQTNAAILPAAIASERAQLVRLAELRIGLEEQIIALQAESGPLLAEAQQRQANQLAQRRELLDASIAEREELIAQGPEIERRIAVFERELVQLQEELGVVTQHRAEAAMNQLLESRNQTERFEVLETAIAPDFPVSSSRRKLAMAGGIGVLMLAIFTALALEILDKRLRTGTQLERELGVRAVVTIPNLYQSRETRGRLVGVGVAAFGVAAGAAWGRMQGWWRVSA